MKNVKGFTLFELMKTSELTGAALDWAVAKCVGGNIRTENGVFLNQGDGYEYFTPSTNWSQAGPIIEREKMAIMLCESDGDWLADLSGTDKVFTASGPTPLIAAMRCYVVSKLGDEVEVPKELIPE